MAHKSLRSLWTGVFFMSYYAKPPAVTALGQPAAYLHAFLKHSPFHIRATRRVAAFDPAKLHICVKAPSALSKSKIVRDHAVARMRQLLSVELRNQGWNWDGTAREDSNTKRSYNLGGAYVIMLKDPDGLTANTELCREGCRLAVERMTTISGVKKIDKVRAPSYIDRTPSDAVSKSQAGEAVKDNRQYSPFERHAVETVKNNRQYTPF